MSIAPVFLYNHSIVDSFPKSLVGIDVASYCPIVAKAQRLLETYEARPSLVAYVNFFFQHDQAQKYINAAVGIHKLAREEGPRLTPDTTVSHMGKQYYPTAWILRDNRRMVPFEFLCEDSIENGRYVDITYLNALWTPYLHEFRDRNHAEDVAIRHVEAIKQGALGLGGFVAIDNDAMNELTNDLGKMESLKKVFSDHLSTIQKLRNFTRNI